MPNFGGVSNSWIFIVEVIQLHGDKIVIVEIKNSLFDSFLMEIIIDLEGVIIILKGIPRSKLQEFTLNP